MLRRLTKQIIRLSAIVLLLANLLTSCTVFQSSSKKPQYVTDIVCGMKVDKAEAYIYKYNGNKYYFDNYNCKEAFKMNPEKFLQNKCTETK